MTPKSIKRVYAVNFHAMIMQQKKKQYAKEKQGTLKRQEKKIHPFSSAYHYQGVISVIKSS